MRRVLDASGPGHVRIFASGGLDEHAIEDLVTQGVPGRERVPEHPWVNEHQRERVGLFLTNSCGRRGPGRSIRALASDLEWIEAQGTALVDQRTVPEADGVALFACRAVGLRDIVPVRTPFEDRFVVDDKAYLTPLAALVEERLRPWSSSSTPSTPA